MRQLLYILLLIFSFTTAPAQTGWRTLGIPNPGPGGRIDDVFFLNDSLGWAAGGIGGSIYITRDGGATWKRQVALGKYLRSIEFINEQVGFCGSLDFSFYKTTNGGQTWTDIAGDINPRPPGICGLSAPDPQHIYGCGIWSFPAYVIKSGDGGNTWTMIDMSAYANALVDIMFLNKDTGFVCGMAKPSSQGGIILKTENGGATWKVVHKTTIAYEYIWKLQTPDNKNFVASIQPNPNVLLTGFLRSNDGGDSWRFRMVKPYYHYIQAIGFIDLNTGWVGGDTALYKTTDGGLTWSENLGVGSAYNRFFRVNSKVAFLTGEKVYKYNALLDGEPPGGVLNEIHSLKVYPNPASEMTIIEAVFNNPTTVRIEIFSSGGERIAHVFSGKLQGDSRMFKFDLGRHAAGIYYVVMRTNEGVITRKLSKQ